MASNTYTGGLDPQERQRVALYSAADRLSSGGQQPSLTGYPAYPATQQRNAGGMQPPAPAQPQPSALTGSLASLNRGGTSFKPGVGPGLTSMGVGVGSNIAAHQVTNALTHGTASPGWASGAAGMGAGIGISMAGDYAAGKLKPKEEMPTFGQDNEWANLMGQYGRRFEGAGPGLQGGAVRGASYGANPALAAATGGASIGIGALGGLIAGAATRNATSAYSDFSAGDAAQGIKDAYLQYLGRPASDQEVMDQLRGQGFNQQRGDRWVGEKGEYSVLGSIRDSPEAQQFRASSGQPATAPGSPAGSAPGPMPGSPDAAPLSTVPGAYDPLGTSGVADMEKRMGLPPGSIQTATGPTASSPSQSYPSFTSSEGPGGITGRQDQPGPSYTQADPAAPTAPSAPRQGLGQYAGLLEGYDTGKLGDPNKHDPKYDIGRIESYYDPHAGITPEMLAELNQLGYGTFSGQGDKLHVDGGSPAFEGVSDFDVARDFGNGGWQWQPEGGPQGGTTPSPGTPPRGSAGTSALTQGLLGGQQGQGYNSDNYRNLVLQYLLQGLGLDRAASRLE